MDWNNELPVTDFDNQEDLEFEPSQLAILRKAKDIGTQRILMQTVVQVEGDITSYITPQFMMMDENDQKALMNVQNSSVKISIEMWQYLFNTLQSLIGSAMTRKKKK